MRYDVDTSPRVEKLEGNGKVSSLEGDVTDRVVRTHHREGDRGIVGYARPEYDKVEDDMTKDELVDVLREIKKLLKEMKG